MNLELIIGVAALALWAIAVVFYFLRRRQVTAGLFRAQEEAKAMLEKAKVEATQISQKHRGGNSVISQRRIQAAYFR